jgi:hypothetical protein
VDAVAYDPTDHGERPRFAVGNDSGDGGYIRMCRASITGNAPADRVLGCSGAHWLPDDAQGVSWAPNASFVVVGTENHVAKALFVNETSPVPGPPWCVVEFWDFFSSGAEIHNTMQTVAVSPAGSFFLVGTDNEAGADWFNLHAYSIDPPQG